MLATTKWNPLRYHRCHCPARTRTSITVTGTPFRRCLRSLCSFLNVPTSDDAQQLFLRMDSRRGSLITEKDRLIKYNQDWTVRNAI